MRSKCIMGEIKSITVSLHSRDAEQSVAGVAGMERNG
uniref:Uncharacterized protein n=1 Tax=Anguilla anguilla TaxID=7936 RepID=A0A0E9R536_ANGAN